MAVDLVLVLWLVGVSRFRCWRAASGGVSLRSGMSGVVWADVLARGLWWRRQLGFCWCVLGSCRGFSFMVWWRCVGVVLWSLAVVGVGVVPQVFGWGVLPFTNHICPEEGPLAVLCGDRHHQPKGTIDTIDLVHASITVVSVTLIKMWVLHRSRAHYTPFLQLPEWPQYRLFHQYLTQTVRATGHTLPGNQDMNTAYRDFKKQHPCPVPATLPYTTTVSKHEPGPPVRGPVPPLTLLLAPNDAKPTQTTVIHQGAKSRIPKHHMTAQDVPKVTHDSQTFSCVC